MSKTVLITGAAKRIGKEIAYTFFNNGWNVIIHFNKSEKEAKNLEEKKEKIEPKRLQRRKLPPKRTKRDANPVTYFTVASQHLQKHFIKKFSVTTPEVCRLWHATFESVWLKNVILYKFEKLLTVDRKLNKEVNRVTGEML